MILTLRIRFMKYIKYSIALVLFLIGFVATAERFVYHLAHFEETFWRISFEYSLYGNEESDSIIKKNLKEALQDYSLDIYCVDTEYLSEYQEVRTIYGTEGALYDLYERGIRPQEYHSIFSGDVKIIFRRFEEIENILDRNDFFVVGSIADAIAFKNATDSNQHYDVKDIREISGSESGLYATLLVIWGSVFILVLLLTLYQGILSKKEIAIRITLGDSHYYIFGVNALSDVAFFSCLFFGSYFIFALFLPVQYKFEFLVVLFVVMLTINTAILYYSTKISPQKDLAKSFDCNGVLAITYAVKLVCILVTSCVLASNAAVISESINYFKQADFFEEVGEYDYYYMSYPSNITSGRVDEENIDETLWYKFQNSFGDNAIWIVDVSEFYNHNAILINRNALPLLLANTDIGNDLKAAFLETEDNKVYLFFPSEYNNAEQQYLAQEMTKFAFLGGINGSDDTLDIVTYSGYSQLIGINKNTNVYGSRLIKNPIIILDTRSSSAYSQYSNVLYSAREVLYRIDPNEFEEFLRTETIEGCITRTTNAKEMYLYNREAVLRNLKLMLAISVFILTIEIAMVVFLIRLKYTISGMELAIKKTLGYTCFARIKGIILITIVSISGCTILGVLISDIFNFGNSTFLIICGGIFLAIEIFVILFEALRMDKLKVCTVLKGAPL